MPPHSSGKTQALILELFGITKQVLPKVRRDSEKSAQSSELIRMLLTWHIASTPKGIVAIFWRSGIAMRWDEIKDCFLATVVPKEADRAQEVYLHERQEEETGDDLISDDELDAITEETD
jgi:hypothetical protein